MYYQINETRTGIHTLGPTVHGGFRWEINGRQTGFRISYLTGFSKSNMVLQNIGGEWNLIEDESNPIPGNRILSLSVIYGIK